MTSNDEARRQAHIELGGMEQIRMQVREVRMGSMLEVLLQDVRYGLRMLQKAKGWTAIVVLSLGLGIGANTLMFSLVNGLLLRTIPVSSPETLVRLRWSGSADLTGVNDTGQADSVTGHPLRSAFSQIIFDRLRQDHQTLSDLFACSLQQAIIFANGESQWEDGLIASGNYYQLLGAHAMLGRTFTPEDDKPGAAPVAVISFDYWDSRFSRDPKIIGSKILANDIPVTIIGVTPREFSGVQNLTETDKNITFPMEMFDSLNQISPTVKFFTDSAWNLQLMGRLKPGITAAQVQGNLNASFQAAAQESWSGRLAGLTPAQRSLPQFQNRTRIPSLLVESGSRGLFDPDSQTIQAGAILTIVVTLLLLIVCANVANLMLSRATTRRSEISLRLSMGATRARLIRQLLTESLILASAGGFLGLLINHWGRTLVPSFRSAVVSDDLPIVNVALMPELDWRVLLFVCALTFLTALIFGLVPALRGTQIDLATELKENSRSVSGSKSFLSKGLLVAQVAISLTLLVGAGLFLRTVQNLRDVAVGFNPHHVLTFHVSLRAVPRGPDFQTRYNSLMDRIAEKAVSLPGVQSIGETSVAYWQSQVVGTQPVFVPGATGSLVMDTLGVSPGYFETMQIPLRNGRSPNVADLTTPVKVALINEIAAQRLFPGQDPIGRKVGFSAQSAGNFEIIGVVGNTKYGSVRAAAQPAIYIPGRATSFVLRTNGDPMQLASSIYDVVRQIDPMVPVTDIETQDDLSNGRIQPERLFAGFYALFGALALLLASIGLFGLMSYNVARRTNELGIRMALGAQRQDVVWLVMRESITLVSVGVVAGVGLAFAANRLIASQLYGLAANDPLTMIFAITLMIAVAALAAYLPARRASRVDPLQALRHE